MAPPRRHSSATAASSSPGRLARRSISASGLLRSMSCATATRSPRASPARERLFVGHRSAQALGDYVTGSNHVLPTSGARARARRAQRGRLRTDHVDSADRRPGAGAARTCGCGARACRGAGRACAIGRDPTRRLARQSEGRSRREGGPAPMTYEYEKVLTPSSGLRLHLNENTAGCAPAVIDALRSITCEEAAFYPDYSRAIAACAQHLPSRRAAASAHQRPRRRDPRRQRRGAPRQQRVCPFRSHHRRSCIRHVCRVRRCRGRARRRDPA